MALHAAHGQVAVQRTATADADAVAEFLVARWFTYDAVVDLLAAPAELGDDVANAVDRIALFVAGQQQPDDAGMRRVRRDELFERDDHRRDTALHVGRAARVQQAIAQRRFEWR